MKILGVFISDRVKEAAEVQNMLTKYGCIIKSRIGLHDVDENKCSQNGIIILQLAGDKNEWVKLEEELKSIAGVEIKNMDF